MDPNGHRAGGGSGSAAAIAEQFATARRHHQAGRLVDAERLYRQICAADPAHAGSFHLLGVAAHQLGRRDAADLIGRALALQPDFAQAHNDLGVVLGACGRFADAAASFERAVMLKPDYAEAHSNLGAARGKLGRWTEATACFERALALDPSSAVAHGHLGHALRAQGRLEEAVRHYEHAAALLPNFAEAHNNLGLALQALGRLEEAVVECERAIALKPAFAGAHNNLANALRDLGKLDRAAAHYARALELEPEFVPAHYNHGVLLRGQGKFAEAAAHFQRALAIEPGFLAAKLALCMAQLPIVYRDEPEIARRRADYRTRLTGLRDEIERAERPGIWADMIGAHQPFYLAYQGCNDRDLQAIYGSVVCRIMAERYGMAALPRPPGPDEPVRVGIVSGFFRHHSNWKIPIKGWLGQLDRRRFRVLGYHTGADRDAETETAAALCDRFDQGPRSVERWRRTILADAPHVLLYPEVGMDPTSAQLAALRLAPVQCNSWGHPETSGFPTLDYFLSSDLMEPPQGENHYTERLVRLPNLSIYYEPPDPRPASLGRSELGLRATATVYWCSQAISKYLPQFDQAFPRIAREAGDCQFVFIQFPGAAHITASFRKRLDQAFAAFGLDAADHCVILPRLDPPRFAAAMAQCDIALDSIGWSGCNSSLESLAQNLPVVTMPGALMRGRHTMAILKMMNVVETVTDTIDGYVSTAIRLARDVPLRAALKTRISESKHRVYRDRSCIAALEAFLDREARRAERA